MWRGVRRVAAVAAVAGAMVGATASRAAAQQAWNLVFGPEAAGATGSGTGTITLTGTSMRFQATWAGLSGLTTISHVHCCTPAPFTGTAGVATPLPTFPGFPTDVRAGSYDATFDMSLPGSWNPAFITASGGTPTAALARLVANMNSGQAYFNIHTSTFGGGEIRAFTVAVPEPSTYALVGGGLLALGAVRARRRRLGA